MESCTIERNPRAMLTVENPQCFRQTAPRSRLNSDCADCVASVLSVGRIVDGGKVRFEQAEWDVAMDMYEGTGKMLMVSLGTDLYFKQRFVSYYAFTNLSRFKFGMERARALRERYFSDPRRRTCEDTCINPVTGLSDRTLAANKKCEDGADGSLEVAGALCLPGTDCSDCIEYVQNTEIDQFIDWETHGPYLTFLFYADFVGLQTIMLIALMMGTAMACASHRRIREKQRRQKKAAEMSSETDQKTHARGSRFWPQKKVMTDATRSGAPTSTKDGTMAAAEQPANPRAEVTPMAIEEHKSNELTAEAAAEWAATTQAADITTVASDNQKSDELAAKRDAAAQRVQEAYRAKIGRSRASIDGHSQVAAMDAARMSPPSSPPPSPPAPTVRRRRVKVQDYTRRRVAEFAAKSSQITNLRMHKELRSIVDDLKQSGLEIKPDLKEGVQVLREVAEELGIQPAKLVVTITPFVGEGSSREGWFSCASASMVACFWWLVYVVFDIVVCRPTHQQFTTYCWIVVLVY